MRLSHQSVWFVWTSSHEKFETGYRQRREFGAMEWGSVFMMPSLANCFNAWHRVGE